ncbi:hypothetical protein M409DRAFT_54021 [Zasmidium cellare ATCC 36951]|uniref:Uncharacterized protein n=1 Tax=Zasmidium cellare ATCC 36951 TaxID=1080233 RepID=A0A6A6CMN9_ZASCE|nr:uncharacterized protein M409DRAFT_54021 [Zasmidium cellare ATCC 36951]KAF2167420.1 hypothetical protein M409DRAFT_54021 [Zasmidium cellare ATCC 36951]
MSPKDSPVSSATVPPSPPSSPKQHCPTVDRLLRIIRLHKAGSRPNHPEEYRPFSLPAAQLEEFQQRLGQQGLDGYFGDKLRWDYDPRERGGSFKLRMPSQVHERFTALVDDAIYESLKGLSVEVKALEDVYKGRSTTIALHAPQLENSSQESEQEDVVAHRSPDATFYHCSRDALPMCVVEVSYSQQRKSLPRLAETYIVDSRHKIRCVVGLDIAYGTGSKEARVSVWRPGTEVDEDGKRVGVCRCDVDAVVVRGSDGSVGEGELVLNMRDFVPKRLLEEADADKTIAIPFARLASLLAAAEARSSTTSPPRSRSSTPETFRKRKRSPSEELSDGREAAYLRLEEAELEKETTLDGEWTGPGWTQEEGGVEVVERRRSSRSKSARVVGEAS